MKEAMAVLNEYWPIVLVALSVLTGILNITTKHFGQHHKGIKKGVAFALDLIAPIVSKGSPGFFKIPILSISQQGAKDEKPRSTF